MALNQNEEMLSNGAAGEARPDPAAAEAPPANPVGPQGQAPAQPDVVDPKQIPGAEELTPEQLDQIKRIALLGQTALSDPQSGADIVDQASKGDEGLIAAVVGVLALVVDKMKLDKSMIIPAGVVLLVVIYNFLVSIERAKDDPNIVGRLIGQIVAHVGKQYGFKPEEMNQMISQAPSQQRPAMNQANAKRGLLGKMMERV